MHISRTHYPTCLKLSPDYTYNPTQHGCYVSHGCTALFRDRGQCPNQKPIYVQCGCEHTGLLGSADSTYNGQTQRQTARSISSLVYVTFLHVSP